jgi:hypothetical protein
VRPPSSRPVPPPPFFHGSRSRIPVGADLRTGIVCGQPGDDFDEREMCWATSDREQARRWSHRFGDPTSQTAYVYEVELDDPEVDTNIHRPGQPPPYHAVMAPRGKVVAVVNSEPVLPFGAVPSPTA